MNTAALPVLIDSDEKKAWVEGRVAPHVFNALAELPGRKRYVQGKPFFELSRSNLEFLDTRLDGVTWQGPAANLVQQFRAMREAEKETRAKRWEKPEDADFPFKVKPYEHQLMAFGLARGKRAFGYFMEQGCVDLDTEYLTPTGWRKISEYGAGKVAQWNLDNTINFVEPEEYHVKPCDTMMRFTSKYGIDQKLSLDHRMLVTYGYKPTRKTAKDGWGEFIRPYGDRWLVETTPSKITEKTSSVNTNRTKCYIPCTFDYNGPGMKFTEAEIRLQVAFIADGSFGSARIDYRPGRKGGIRIKKERKKDRLVYLLEQTKIPYTRRDTEDGFSIFTFLPPTSEKHFTHPHWWEASRDQLRIIAEESLHWDGSVERNQFYSSDKRDADFIQFCFNATGRRSRLGVDRREGWRDSYVITNTEEPLELLKGQLEPTEDGKMYCFTVPSTYLVFRRNGCVFVSGNTGKTKVLLDDAADIYLNGGDEGKIDTLIIIAPNGVHAQWVNEQIPEHLTQSVAWVGGYTVAAPSMEQARRLRKAKEFKDGLRIVAIHIDMMSHASGKTLLRELLLSSRAMLVVDESSRIKDSASKRTKALLELGRLAKYRRILTGTPISQGVEDLYSQFAFLDKNILGYNSFFAFRNHFCRMGGFQNKKIVGYVNEDELKRKIDSYTYRVLKEDCLDLPEKNFIRHEVLFTDEQAEVYQAMKKDFFLDLEAGILTARLALTRLIRLQQLIGGFIWKREKKDKGSGAIIEPEVYQEFPNNRVARTIDIIHEAQGKVIVWLKFEGDWRLLTRALTAAKIGWVDYVGSTPQSDRLKNIESFRSDAAVKVFLSSPKSGGVGLNLTVASEVIWYSRDFSLENELQANDRCHRIGQHFPVNYHYLITPRSVDERIDKVLKSKKAVAENLIDIRDLFADDE